MKEKVLFCITKIEGENPDQALAKNTFHISGVKELYMAYINLKNAIKRLKEEKETAGMIKQFEEDILREETKNDRKEEETNKTDN